MKNNAAPIYLTGLLFAIAFNVTWLIITFSILLFIVIFAKLNAIHHWIGIKEK